MIVGTPEFRSIVVLSTGVLLAACEVPVVPNADVISNADASAQSSLQGAQDVKGVQIDLPERSRPWDSDPDALVNAIIENGGRALVAFKEPGSTKSLVSGFRSPVARGSIQAGRRAVTALGAEVVAEFAEIGAISVRFPDVRRVKQLFDHPLVDYIEPPVQMRVAGEMVTGASATGGTAAFRACTPSSSTECTPWGIDKIGVASQWGSWSGSGAKLLVIDSPYQRTHPDLPLIPTANCGEYQPEDWDGCVPGTSSHGTHVVGIATARDNTQGIIGAAPGIAASDLFVFPGCDPNDVTCDSDAIIAGVQFGISQGVDVINMSFAGEYHSGVSNILWQAMYYHDILLIAAAGNNNGGVVRYPAGYLTTVAVSGHRENGNFAINWGRCEDPFGEIGESNWGLHIDVAAPFEAWSTIVGSGYQDGWRWCGTSMAAPYVAGTAAIMRAKNPTLSRVQIRDLITGNATDAGEPGFDHLFGFGRLNAGAAIAATPTPPPPVTATIGGPSDPELGQWCTWFGNVSGGSGSTSYTWYRNGSQVGTSSTYSQVVSSSFLLELRVVRSGQEDWDEINVQPWWGGSQCSL